MPAPGPGMPGPTWRGLPGRPEGRVVNSTWFFVGLFQPLAVVPLFQLREDLVANCESGGTHLFGA